MHCVERDVISNSLKRAIRPTLAALLAILLLAVSTISACPSLHHFLHSDAGTSSHQCLVCSFAKGQISAAEVSGVFAALMVSLVGLALLPEFFHLPSFDFRLSHSRAPPRR